MNLTSKLIYGFWPCLAVFAGLWFFGSAWAAILLYHAPIVFTILRNPGLIAEVRRGFRWLPALGGAAIGLATIPAVIWMLPMLVQMEPGQAGTLLHNRLSATGLAAPWFAIFFGYFTTIHPILEELGWRTILSSDSRFPHALDFEFAAYHLLVLGYFFPGAWPLLATSFLVLAASGWLWRQMQRELGGLASAIVFHAAADAGILAAVGWLAFVVN